MADFERKPREEMTDLEKFAFDVADYFVVQNRKEFCDKFPGVFDN